MAWTFSMSCWGVLLPVIPPSLFFHFRMAAARAAPYTVLPPGPCHPNSRCACALAPIRTRACCLHVVPAIHGAQQVLLQLVPVRMRQRLLGWQDLDGGTVMHCHAHSTEDDAAAMQSYRCGQVPLRLVPAALLSARTGVMRSRGG
jgi:hypothetical protein